MFRGFAGGDYSSLFPTTPCLNRRHKHQRQFCRVTISSTITTNIRSLPYKNVNRRSTNRTQMTTPSNRTRVRTTTTRRTLISNRSIRKLLLRRLTRLTPTKTNKRTRTRHTRIFIRRIRSLIIIIHHGSTRLTIRTPLRLFTLLLLLRRQRVSVRNHTSTSNTLHPSTTPINTSSLIHRDGTRTNTFTNLLYNRRKLRSILRHLLIRTTTNINSTRTSMTQPFLKSLLFQRRHHRLATQRSTTPSNRLSTLNTSNISNISTSIRRRLLRLNHITRGTFTTRLVFFLRLRILQTIHLRRLPHPVRRSLRQRNIMSHLRIFPTRKKSLFRSLLHLLHHLTSLRHIIVSLTTQININRSRINVTNSKNRRIVRLVNSTTNRNPRRLRPLTINRQLFTTIRLFRNLIRNLRVTSLNHTTTITLLRPRRLRRR